MLRRCDVASDSAAPSVTVIIIAHARDTMLQRCIASLRAQTRPDFEAIVVLNGANTATTQVAEQAAAEDPRVQTLSTQPMSASLARNAGAQHARSPILYFLDDDVTIPEDALNTLAGIFTERPELALVGGPNLTPPDDPPFAHLTGAVLGSMWGTGITHARYVAHEEGPARERDLILCNLAVARRVFEDGPGFPRLFGGEENVLAGSLEERGESLWYCPRLWVYHHRRRTVGAFIEQIYRYGWGRGNAAFHSPNNASPLYFLPVAWLVYLLATPLLAGIEPGLLVGLPVYALGTLVAALTAAARHRRPLWVPALLLLFPVTHITYAVGLLKQLAMLWFQSVCNRVRNRLWA
jgi:succinoglycan biosynthesis protein ExoA